MFIILKITNEKVEKLENLTESLLNSITKIEDQVANLCMNVLEYIPKVNNDCSCELTISNETNSLCGRSKSNQLSNREPVFTETFGYTKPSIYDGTTNWLEYKLHFESVAKLNSWSEDIKVLKLITCINGAALSILADIEIDNIPTYSNLVKILTKRFAPENLTDVYMSQIDACIRKPGQPLQELADDIKRLIRMAYPSATLDTRDYLTYMAFRKALNDHDLELAILQSNVETIDGALYCALKCETFRAREKRFRQQPKFETAACINAKANQKCYFCNEKGHTIRGCPKRT
ncbi:unnamed protein product [Mytilus coruscus]|uniref:CCHC-type domain-containing protein n=1 Tax=Mytilus coruscus TaxID=42192 RepID=A0A6J8CID4_MYTCO|nr:unnamed protein product [Mytilus coruscus]